ncbi:copper homeostasis CutC domain-containing protein, partial [Fomitopsis serialis]|uniref:copper homeostasis CutC domain-containing protein n=1 Tax=Fomitopsis serialis TaxID=139415 RepID=UPI0020089C40
SSTDVRLLLEVCIDSVDSAVAAVAGGADRLELCGTLAAGGGVSPSLGLFRAVKKAVPQISIMVMIRPRTGDFVYSSDELEVMTEDIRVFKGAGAAGVVFGILTREGDIDVRRSTLLANEAQPLEICFHRAFDMTRDIQKAFEDARKIPHISRVLTSGHEPKCTSPAALANLSSLFRAMHEDEPQHQPHTLYRFNILPGSGVSPHTVRSVLLELLPLGLNQIHMSGGRWVPGEAQYRKDGMGMGVGEGEWAVWRTNEEYVREVVEIISATCREFVQQRTQG